MAFDGLAEHPVADVCCGTVGKKRLAPSRGEKDGASPAGAGDVSLPSLEGRPVGDAGRWAVRIRLDVEGEATENDFPETWAKLALGRRGLWVVGVAAGGVPAATDSELSDVGLRGERH